LKEIGCDREGAERSEGERRRAEKIRKLKELDEGKDRAWRGV